MSRYRGIFDLYEQGHDAGETFRQFAARTPSAWWEARLAAEADAVTAPA